MDTKDHLLDCAEHLARTRGFDAFSYADLSKEVGIRKASIHYHFPTKSDLAASLIERYSERFLGQLYAVSEKDGTAGHDVRAYVDLYRQALAKGTQLCLCVSFSAARDSFDEATLARLNAFHDRSLAWLATVFEKAKTDGSMTGTLSDPETEAHACLALVEGAQLVARAARSEVHFNRAVTPLLDRLSDARPH